ncbi:MAG: hypothetical protein ACFFAO_15715, partial [Candidatus Hermodarchaeota archaeon]
LMEITLDIIVNGIFSLIAVIVFIIIGLKIMLKYKESKDKVHFLIGLAWIGISEPWWPSSIGFILALFFGTSLSVPVYILINCGILPLFLSFWLIALMIIMQLNKRIIILVSYIVIALVLEIVMIYYLIIDSSMVGVLVTPVDISFGPVAVVFLLYNLSVFMISGILLTINTIKLDDPVDKLRGKFLLVAFLLFMIGASLEMLINHPLNRVILLLSSIMFYIGFMMPKSIKEKFLK